MKTSNKTIFVTLSVITVMAIGAYFLLTGVGNDTKLNQTSSTVSKIEFRNGSYEESVSYQVPKSTNTLKAVITIRDNVITDVQTTHVYTSQKSKEYTDPFDIAVKKQVIGKKISDYNLNILGGASLTSDAFKKIIEAIENKAKI